MHTLRTVAGVVNSIQFEVYESFQSVDWTMCDVNYNQKDMSKSFPTFEFFGPKLF